MRGSRTTCAEWQLCSQEHLLNSRGRTGNYNTETTDHDPELRGSVPELTQCLLLTMARKISNRNNH